MMCFSVTEELRAWNSDALFSAQRICRDTMRSKTYHEGMSVRIALVRALNLGAAHRLPMAKLRALAQEIGLADAKTIGQKGNLVFESRAAAASLEKKLDAAIAESLPIETQVFVRTPAELRAVIARNPFEKEAARDPAHVLVYFTKKKPSKRGVAALRNAIDGPELVRAGARHLYLFYPKGIGRSKLTSALMDSKLGVRGTARNWNTVAKLAALSR